MARRSSPTLRSDAVLVASALVGRDDVLARLRTVLTGGAVALIEGEAGVGKSRLVAELRAVVEMEGRRVRVGHCQPHRDPLPLLPIVEAVRDVGPLLPSLGLTPLAGALRPLLPELADRLPAALEPTGDPHAERYRLFRALRELFVALGRTVLVVEDLHWSDPVTVELLRFLAADMPLSLAVMLTYRDDDLSRESDVRSLTACRGLGNGPLANARSLSRTPAPVARFRLEPLDHDGVCDMVRAMLDLAEVSTEFSAFLYERTEGLPFAVEEVLRLLVDRRDLVFRDGAWERHEMHVLDVPDAIRDAIVERLDRLPARARDVVLACAVVAEPVGEDLLCAIGVLDLTGAVDVLHAAVRSGLLEETADGRLRFRHVLAREAAYGALSGPERRRLHLRVGRALEATRDCPPSRLAQHFRNADAWPEWIRYAERAADEVARLHDERTACRILVEVLDSERLASAERVRLARKLGVWALEGSAAAAAAEVLGAVLAENSPDPYVRGELRYGRARALSAIQRMPEAAAEWARAVPDLADRPDLAARAMSSLGMPWVEAGSLEDHRRWMERAAALSGAVSSPICRLMVHDDEAAALTLAGDPRARAAVAALPADVERVDERRELVRGLCNVAEGAVVVGHYQLATDLFARAGALDDRAQDRLVRAAHRDQAMLAWFTGRWDDVDPATGGLAALLVAQARTVDRSLIDRLAAAAQATRGNGCLGMGMTAAAAVSASLLAAGQADRAAEVADMALTIVRRKGAWAWAADIAGAAVAAALAIGSVDRARAVADELAASSSNLDAPACAAARTSCTGLLADADDDRTGAAEWFEAAYGAWAAMPRPYDAALARERCGVALLDIDEARAHEHLVGALEELQRLGAVPAVRRVGRILRERGARIPTRLRPRWRSYGTRLSAREAEVADLAAAGRTNKEIAAVLALSPRTVEHHMERVLRKVGATSRAELRGMAWTRQVATSDA